MRAEDVTSFCMVLIRFDISGAGACLKRYTDPSFVRLETSSYEASWDDIQREKKSQKAKVVRSGCSLCVEM